MMIPLGIYRTERVSFKMEDSLHDRGGEHGGSGDTSVDGGYHPNDNAQLNIQVDETMKKGQTFKHGNNNNQQQINDDKEVKDKKEIKYVITNPDKELILKDKDVVFVLAQNDPREHMLEDQNQKKGNFFNFNNLDNVGSKRKPTALTKAPVVDLRKIKKVRSP